MDSQTSRRASGSSSGLSGGVIGTRGESRSLLRQRGTAKTANGHTSNRDNMRPGIHYSLTHPFTVYFLLCPLCVRARPAPPCFQASSQCCASAPVGWTQC